MSPEKYSMVLIPQFFVEKMHKKCGGTGQKRRIYKTIVQAFNCIYANCSNFQQLLMTKLLNRR